MPTAHSVRYGRNYKVVLAIVLPCLLIVPFILVLAQFKSLEEWKVWLVIFAFLGVIAALAMWLVLRAHPIATLGIDNNEIRLSFDRSRFPGRPDFSFDINDIIFLKRREIGGDAYFLFQTRNPYRKFQISPSSSSFEELISFDHTMSEMMELVNRSSESK